MPDARSGYRPAGAPAANSPAAQQLWFEANQVFERRCVVCHGCYDAPCQLKLESFAGVERGATSAVVYDGSRLTAAEPTRLFVDAQTLAEWRAKDFHSVLPDQQVADPRRSVMMRTRVEARTAANDAGRHRQDLHVGARSRKDLH
jgi:hypothetical protein